MSDRLSPTATTLSRWFLATKQQQQALAHHLGVSQQYVCDMAHGRRRIPDELIRRCPRGLRQSLIRDRKVEYRMLMAALDAAASPARVA